MGEVCSGPVEHGHEVVANGVYALFAQVLEAHLVVFYELVAVGSCIFDTFAHGQTFHHAPTHAVAFYVSLEIMNFLACPDFSVWHIVQCRDNALHTDLLEHGKCNFVVLAKPSPSSFHNVCFCNNNYLAAKIYNWRK